MLQILFAFSEHRVSASVADLAELIEVPVPTAYRHVALLKEMQLLEEGAPGRYHPTARVMPLARAAQMSNSLVSIAGPIVADSSAEFGETVMLFQHYGDGVVCIELTECDRPMRFTFQRGHSLPLGSGASGKMCLALLPDAEQQAWMKRTARLDLAGELAEIRVRGYATSSSEVDEGVWACSVPATMTGKHPTVLTVAGPAARFDEEARAAAPVKLGASAARIREEAARLSFDAL